MVRIQTRDTAARRLRALVLAGVVGLLALPAAAQAGAVGVSLSNQVLTLTGSSTADVVTIDYEAAVSSPTVQPNRFELIAGAGTTFSPVSGCTVEDATHVYCAATSVTTFNVNLNDGNDTLWLNDEDPARGTEVVTANMGVGNDKVDTTFQQKGTFFSTINWSDAFTANGDDGDDTLEGALGNDTLNGGNGNDTISASSGNDTLNGGADNDTLNASTGDDTLNGSSGNDTLRGSTGNDALNASSGDDALFGDSGDDVLTPSSGADTVDGGDGTDTASYADRISIAFLGIFASPVNVSLDGAANDGAAGENDNVGPGIENLTGGSAGDTLAGDDGPNTILGGSGDDMLRGSGAADILDGQADSDTATGGAGPDDLRDTGTTGADLVDYSDTAANVRIDLNGGPGQGPEADPDALAPAFEHARGGPADDDLTGTPGDNILSGGTGNDVLDGQAGADTLGGGDGNDKLNGGDGNDTVLGEAGNDLVEGAAGSDPKLDGGDGADVVTGGPGGADDADALAGGQGRDQITYEGRKTGVSVTMDNVANDGAIGEKDNVASDFEGLVGGDGPDVLKLTALVRLSLIYVPIIRPLIIPITLRPTSRISATQVVEPGRFVQAGLGNDSITGSVGNDALTGGPGRDKILGGAGNDAVHGGSGDDNVDGGDGNDRVYGDEGNDFLLGGKGFDVLLAADRLGRDKSECGEDNDTLLRDVRDLIRKTSPCERTVGLDKLKRAEETGTNPLDGDEIFGPDGDEFADTDGDGAIGPDDWANDFATDSFDDFGATFDDSFFGFDELGDFGDASEIAGAIMKLKTGTAKVKRNAFKVGLGCPKAATRRCVGEITITIKPKRGKAKALGSELFRTNKGKDIKISFKLRAKLRKLIPKGKKGIEARVVVEARDGGDLLFGLDQTLTLRR